MLVLSATQWANAQSAEMDPESAGQEFLLRADEYAGYQIDSTNRLSNRQFQWRSFEGSIGTVTVDSKGLLKEYRTSEVSLETSAEIFELADELFYTSFALDDGRRAITLIFDRVSKRMIEIISRRPNAAEGSHRAQVRIIQGQLGDELDEAKPLGTTDKMAGVRLVAHYSDEIAYEHIYLNPHRVTWHGVTGPEAGVADTERYEAYELRKNIFLVSWSEKVLTTHMIFLFDFASNHEIGTIFGYEPEHDKSVLETIGAKTEILQGPSH